MDNSKMQSNKLIMFTIRDNKVGAYMPPMFVPHKATLMRLLHEMVLNQENNLCKYPQDYELYELGVYDQDSGTITQHDKPIAVDNVTNIKEGAKIES